MIGGHGAACSPPLHTGRAGPDWHAEYMLVRDTGRCPEATDTKLDNVLSQAVRGHVPSEHVGCTCTYATELYRHT